MTVNRDIRRQTEINRDKQRQTETNLRDITQNKHGHIKDKQRPVLEYTGLGERTGIKTGVELEWEGGTVSPLERQGTLSVHPHFRVERWH